MSCVISRDASASQRGVRSNEARFNGGFGPNLLSWPLVFKTNCYIVGAKYHSNSWEPRFDWAFLPALKFAHLSFSPLRFQHWRCNYIVVHFSGSHQGLPHFEAHTVCCHNPCSSKLVLGLPSDTKATRLIMLPSSFSDATKTVPLHHHRL